MSGIKTLHLDTVLEKHSQDMSNKVVAITGTTSGTGFCCAREVAKKGATVILLNRKSSRSEEALKKLQEAVPGATFDAVECDLQNFDSVRSAMETIKSKYTVIDVLVNNAGVMALRDQATKDGYDVQIQTNCISHFLITKELFPLIKKSAQGRVINHTSMARLGGPLEAKYFEKRGGDLGGDGTEEESNQFQGPRWARYHQTKLANCCFTYGLDKKLKEKNISNVLSLLAHPGLAKTELQATTGADGGMDHTSSFMDNAQSPEDGATGIIRACMDPESKSGDFYGPPGFTGFPGLITPEELLSDPSNVEINWKGCEAAVGEFEV